jgi:hypothetical protein
MTRLWLSRSAAVLCLCGCDQVLGIQDVVTHHTDAKTFLDSSEPPNDGLGSSCATLPMWALPMQFNAPGATSLAVGNVDGGPVPDIVVATGSDILVFPNTGHGQFGAPHALRGSASPAMFVSVADINQDGREDVVAQGSAGLAIYLQSTTAGSFDAPTPVTATFGGLVCDIKDLNHDQFPDLVFCDATVGFLLSSGGTFSGSETTLAQGVQGALAQAIDVDGDGFPDIVFVDAAGPPQVAFNTSSAPGTFATPISIGADTGAGLSYGRYSGGSAIDAEVVGRGDALFDQTAPRVFTEVNTNTLALPPNSQFQTLGVDLNNDGRDDMVTLAPGAYILQCPTAGTFFPSSPVGPGGLLFPIENVQFIGDVSGDGLPDLVGFGQNLMPGGSNTFEVSLHE